MVSVVLAAYHGEKYIAHQVSSILQQLSETDELIISDDDILAHTKKAVFSKVGNDARVRYIEGPSKGLIKNFENALYHVKGDIVFLSDQDDVWLPGKVDACKKALGGAATLVMHNAFITDESLNKTGDDFFSTHKVRRGYMQNIMRNSYKGCCMAFRVELLDLALPFPASLPMHDQWLGLLAEKYGKTLLMDDAFILHRRHSESVTGGDGGTVKEKIQWRYSLIKDLKSRNNSIAKRKGDGDVAL